MTTTRAVARERLHPSLRSPSYLVLRARRRLLEARMAGLDGPVGVVLDVGGRHQPYRSLLPSGRYVAVDLRRTDVVDVIGDGHALPLASATVDIVLCTQVLQYCTRPEVVVSELRRVLAPGGRCFVTVPASYPIDDPDECWRFLPGGLRHLFRDFASVEVVPEGNTVVGFLRTTNLYLTMFARGRWSRALVGATVVPALNLLGVALDRVTANAEFSVNHLVEARV